MLGTINNNEFTFITCIRILLCREIFYHSLSFRIGCCCMHPRNWLITLRMAMRQLSLIIFIHSLNHLILSYHFISQLWICVSSLISILRYLSRPFGLGAWLDLVSFILLMAREDDLGDFLTCIDGTFRHASTSVALLGRFLGWSADV
jgi:hypothetical protein